MNKVTVTKLPKSQVEIKVEVPAEDFSVFIEKALAEISKDAQIAGFRRGAAPKEIVRERIGTAKVLDRAASLAIEASIPAAVAENKLEPLGYPQVNILKLAQGNPFEYRAVMAVYPQVDLPDYEQIASGFELKKVEVTPEDINRLKMEKERHLREHLREDALAAIVLKANVEVPDVLIERETERMMGQLKEKTPRALNMSFEEYLGKLGKTEEELRQTMARDNELKIKNYLVLQELGKSGKIEIADSEIESAMKKETGADQQASAESSGEAREYYRENLKTEKTFEFLETFFKK